MKKRLALLLSVAMAFSMFANVAFGAEATLTTEQKYEALVEAGIFNGIPGSNDPQLNVQTDRAQFAKILALTTGLEQVTNKSSFTDSGYATNWAKGYIEAVVAAGYMEGTGNGKFDLTGKITGEQMAKSFAGALGLEEVKDAEAIEGVSSWAYGWVAAAKNAGFDFSMNGKWNTPVTRSVLVEAAYVANQKTGVSVKSAVALDEKTVKVTFSDDSVKQVTLETALVEGVATDVTVTHDNGKQYKVSVTLGAFAIEAKATGASKIELSMTRAIDTAKAKVEVKRGSSVVTVKEVTYVDDLKATIQLSNKMVAGDYTVTVSGVTETPVTSTFTAEAEKVESIELLGEVAPANDDYSGFSVAYSVLNQYGEDASNIANITWTLSKGKKESDSNGVLTVTGSTYGANQFTYNESVVVTALDNNTYKHASKTYTIGLPAKASTVEFGELYHADGETLTTSSTFGEFYIPVVVKDQYGNKLNLDAIGESVKLISSNPTIASVETELQSGVGANNDSLGIQLATPSSSSLKFSGDVTISAIALGSGQTFTKTINVATGTEVATIKLSVPDTVAANDDSVKIPFVAYDKNGDEVTSYSKLSDIKLNASSGKADWKKDYSTGKAYISYTPDASKTDDYTEVVYAMISNTGANSQIIFTVQEPAVPTQVSGTTANTNLAVGATLTLDDDNLVINDQFGRKFDIDKALATYNVGITKSSVSNILSKKLAEIYVIDANGVKTKVENADKDVLLPAGGDIQLVSTAKGTQSVELALFDSAKAQVKSSSTSFNVSIVEKGNITEYAVDDIGSIISQEVSVTGITYGNIYDRTTDIAVYGVKSDGSKIKLAASDYTVQVDSEYLEVTSGSTIKTVAGLYPTGTTDKADKTTTVSVTINAADAPVVIKKDVTISNAAPVAQSFSTGTSYKTANVVSLSGNTVTVKATNGTVNIADVMSVVKMTDQYGETNYIGTDAYTATVTNISSNNKSAEPVNNGKNASGVSVTGLISGDTFIVTIYAKNQTSIQLTVGVE